MHFWDRLFRRNKQDKTTVTLNVEQEESLLVPSGREQTRSSISKRKQKANKKKRKTSKASRRKNRK